MRQVVLLAAGDQKQGVTQGRFGRPIEAGTRALDQSRGQSDASWEGPRTPQAKPRDLRFQPVPLTLPVSPHSVHNIEH